MQNIIKNNFLMILIYNQRKDKELINLVFLTSKHYKNNNSSKYKKNMLISHQDLILIYHKRNKKMYKIINNSNNYKIIKIWNPHPPPCPQSYNLQNQIEKENNQKTNH